MAFFNQVFEVGVFKSCTEGFPTDTGMVHYVQCKPWVPKLLVVFHFSSETVGQVEVVLKWVRAARMEAYGVGKGRGY